MNRARCLATASALASAALQAVQAHGLPHAPIGWVALAGDAVLGYLVPLISRKEPSP